MSSTSPSPELTDGVVRLRPVRDPERTLDLAVEHDGVEVGRVGLEDRGGGVGVLTWLLHDGHTGNGYATRALRLLVDYAIDRLHLQRVEAEVPAGHDRALRVATRSGLHREGVRRVTPDMAAGMAAGMAEGTAGEGATSLVVLARLATDPPVTDPSSFRALLNSFLPRKRAISQLLMRDPDGRVLMCQLTYKPDWDLPGGVVEVGESPQVAVAREVEEELGVGVKAGRLLLADWLPPWGGWDDALCLVFDGGVHAPDLVDQVVREVREIRSVRFATPEEVREHARDFTARRVEAALAALAEGSGAAYTESGR